MSTLRFLYSFSSIINLFFSYKTARELQNVIISLHGYVSSVDFPVSGSEQSGILFAWTFSIEIYIWFCFVLFCIFFFNIICSIQITYTYKNTLTKLRISRKAKAKAKARAPGLPEKKCLPSKQRQRNSIRGRVMLTFNS